MICRVSRVQRRRRKPRVHGAFRAKWRASTPGEAHSIRAKIAKSARSERTRRPDRRTIEKRAAIFVTDPDASILYGSRMPLSFPQEAVLRDERRVLLRPFTSADTDATLEFFRSLPAVVQRAAWDRIDKRSVVESWAEDIDHDKVVPVMALDGTRVVAHASLHYRKDGPLRRIGNLRWLLHPEYRGDGLGTMIVNLFTRMARDNGLSHLTCMLIDGLEDDALVTLKSLGFEEHRLERYGTDPDGNPADMLKMILEL